MVITPDLTRADLLEALANLSHDAGRVTVADKRHADLHAQMDELLTALEGTPP